MNIEKITINKLKMDVDSFILVLSARRTGKSVLVADLIHYYLTDTKNKIDYLYVFSNTAGLESGTNEQYDFIDRKCIIPAKMEVMEQVIYKLMASQKKTNFKFHILLVFDDIVVTHKYEILDTLASMGRHYKITTILSAQVANLAISPTIRNNASYILWRRLTNTAIRDNLYPILGIAFDNSIELRKFTNENIGDYQFLFYNNNKDFDENSIKIVKASEVPKDFEYKIKICKEPRDIAQKMDRFRGKGAYIEFDKKQSMFNPNGLNYYRDK
jgi:hypothetical protein